MVKEKIKTWTVKFSVYEYWIDAGFDLTEEVAKRMIENVIPYAVGGETAVEILKAPKKM